MDAIEIKRGLGERGISAAELEAHDAFPVFVDQMRYRQYGNGPLVSGWLWFRDGWDAAKESTP